MSKQLGAKHAFVNFQQAVNKQDHSDEAPQTQMQRGGAKHKGGQPKGNAQMHK